MGSPADFILSVVVCIGLGDVAVAAVPPGGASQFIRRLGDEAIPVLRAPDTSLEARDIAQNRLGDPGSSNLTIIEHRLNHGSANTPNFS